MVQPGPLVVARGRYPVERLLGPVQLDVMALTPLREQELDRQAGAAFDLEGVRHAIAAGIAFTGADADGKGALSSTEVLQALRAFGDLEASAEDFRAT